MSKIKIRFFPRAIKALTEAQRQAVGMTAEQMLAELITSQTMPFFTGHLQNVATYVDTKELRKGTVKIVHDTPYARRLYYNPQFNFERNFNIRAGGLWWEPWLTGRLKKRPTTIFRKFYRSLTEGLIE